MDLIFFILGSLFLLAILYLFFLAIVSLWPSKGHEDDPAPSIIKFAIVIPAHNESSVIGRTIESIKNIDYPIHLFDTYVIADNCDDDTAGIARYKGVICWERRDPSRRGKGFVLGWAFERLLKEGDHRAYVVIDADTVVDRDFLRAMNSRILKGARAVQGYYDVLNPECSTMGSLSYLSFVLSRNLRYTGRTRLGWTTNLLGNGMCFTREVIEKVGWPATSIVEDIEYEMILHLKGIRVEFAPEARIYAEIPETMKASRVQRGRWDVGKFRVRNRYLPLLLKEGFRRMDPGYFDSAMELLIPPFSLFVLLLSTGAALYLVLDFRVMDINFIIWTVCILGLGLYIITGLITARAGPKIYLSLVYAPVFLLWRLWVVVRGLYSKDHTVWVKTGRK